MIFAAANVAPSLRPFPGAEFHSADFAGYGFGQFRYEFNLSRVLERRSHQFNVILYFARQFVAGLEIFRQYNIGLHDLDAGLVLAAELGGAGRNYHAHAQAGGYDFPPRWLGLHDQQHQVALFDTRAGQHVAELSRRTCQLLIAELDLQASAVDPP